MRAGRGEEREACVSRQVRTKRAECGIGVFMPLRNLRRLRRLRRCGVVVEVLVGEVPDEQERVLPSPPSERAIDCV